MITKFMELTTKKDADQWASELGFNTKEQEARASAWISVDTILSMFCASNSSPRMRTLNSGG